MTKKKCSVEGCSKTGKTVKATVDNTTQSGKPGTRRCRCKAHR
jgi:hypothetical protein